jgi:glycine/serine hydroxymethyltransferase
MIAIKVSLKIVCLSKDPELYKAIKDELIRQQQHIELIASENIVSQAVLRSTRI